MTDSDLQTVRTWCAVNNVTVSFRGRGNYLEYYPRGLPASIAKLESDWAEPHEHLVYAKLWKHLQPWYETVLAMFKPLEAENTALRKLATNVVRHELDAVEVEGPYQAQPWKIREGVQYYCVTNSMSFDFFADMSEQTARTIANILNRECGDGK